MFSLSASIIDYAHDISDDERSGDAILLANGCRRLAALEDGCKVAATHLRPTNTGSVPIRS
jgi:hypothetical protein